MDKSSTFFGLPKEVIYCKKCVVSNQRPNSAIEFQHTIDSKKDTIIFDKNGVCDACNFAVKKNTEIIWDQKEKELFELAEKYKGHSGKYNCIVPGSGGKDSFYQSHILRNKYGFRTLTITWAPHL